MNLYKYTPYAIALLLLTLLVLLFGSTANLRKQVDSLQTEKDLINQQFKSEKNKNGELITLQDIIVTNDKKIMDSLVQEINWGKQKIKNPKTIIKETLVTKIDSLYVPFTDTLITIVGAKYEFKDSTPFYNLSGTVESKGIKFNTISFINENTYVINKKRYNVFYTKPVLYVNTKNPYTTVTGLKSITLEKQPNKLLKFLTVSASFALGAYVGIQISK